MKVFKLRRALQKFRGDEEVVICGSNYDEEPSPLVAVQHSDTFGGNYKTIFLMSDKLLQDMVARDLADQAGLVYEG